tara:strand:+ start:1378 stop:1584 length:207 start_codon:yes stop_codon:yes gene_type:complete
MRKNRRQALRETKRVGLLQEQIFNEMLMYNKLEAYTPAMSVYDIKDSTANSEGLIVMGGMIGQIIIIL